MDIKPTGPATGAASDASTNTRQNEVITAEQFMELATAAHGVVFNAGTHYIIKSDLRLEQCKIVSMPDRLTVKGRFDMRECQIDEIRSCIEVDHTFFINRCDQLKSIYGKIQTGKAFSIRGLEGLEDVACALKVGAQIDATACKRLRTLADSDIEVGEYLSLRNCTQLKELPKKTIDVGKHLNLRGCTSLEIDNKGYTIRHGGDIYSISALPKDNVLVNF